MNGEHHVVDMQVRMDLPCEIAGVPRPVCIQSSQIHFLQTDWTGVLLAHQSPATYALIMK